MPAPTVAAILAAGPMNEVALLLGLTAPVPEADGADVAGDAAVVDDG